MDLISSLVELLENAYGIFVVDCYRGVPCDYNIVYLELI
jgi:hypothetical protein